MTPPPAGDLWLMDARARAIVAMAPAGVPLSAESLAAVRPATLIFFSGPSVATWDGVGLRYCVSQESR